MTLSEGTPPEMDKFIISYIFQNMKANPTEFGDILSYEYTPRKSFDSFPLVGIQLIEDNIRFVGQGTEEHTAIYQLFVIVQSFSTKDNAEWLYKKRENIKNLIDQYKQFAYSSGGSNYYPLQEARVRKAKISFGTIEYGDKLHDHLTMWIECRWLENLPAIGISPAH